MREARQSRRRELAPNIRVVVEELHERVDAAGADRLVAVVRQEREVGDGRGVW